MRITLNSIRKIALLWLLVGLVAGCETTPEQALANRVQRELEDAPGWVLGGCMEYFEADEPRLCGVGSMGGTRNIALARTTAMARARTEIARSLNVRVESMLKDYQANTATELSAATDEQDVVDVSRQITEISLTGTELEETWVSDSGTIYALMSLDLERFEASLDRLENLPGDVREGVRERAAEAFSDLDHNIESETDPIW